MLLTRRHFFISTVALVATAVVWFCGAETSLFYSQVNAQEKQPKERLRRSDIKNATEKRLQEFIKEAEKRGVKPTEKEVDKIRQDLIAAYEAVLAKKYTLYDP